MQVFFPKSTHSGEPFLVLIPQNLTPYNNNQQEEKDCSSQQKQSDPSDDPQVSSKIQPSTAQNQEDAQKLKVYSR